MDQYSTEHWVFINIKYIETKSPTRTVKMYGWKKNLSLSINCFQVFFDLKVAISIVFDFRMFEKFQKTGSGASDIESMTTSKKLVRTPESGQLMLTTIFVYAHYCN